MENNVENKVDNKLDNKKKNKRMNKMDNKFYNSVKKMQSDELLEKQVYDKLVKHIKNEKDIKTLKKIAKTEERHYQLWKEFTKVDVEPNGFVVNWYVFLGIILGYTFVLKVMENRNDRFVEKTTKTYRKQIRKNIKGFDTILRDETQHEKLLIDMIDEERLKYVGSIVLGLNDALVEFTGALAGWSLAMQSNNLITLTGLITGVSATLSMASSEYLSNKADGNGDAFKAAIYTGVAYLLTVIILILPYLLLPDNAYMLALLIMLILAVVIIAIFNYYIAVVRGVPFFKKFKEMSMISLTIAIISFIIGLLVKHFLKIEV
jgi:vacuolar iron transporter family protein